MTVWWQALFSLCCMLNCMELSCASTSVYQRAKYNNSLRLTRFIRTRVQQLLKTYKEQQLGIKDFEDRSQQLSALPLLSTDFYSWLTLMDWERLHAAFRDLNTYWEMLEQKKKELEREEEEQGVAQGARHRARRTVTLPQSIGHIQLDLRDLIRQVNSQIKHVKGSRASTASPTVPTISRGLPSSYQPASLRLWASRLEGYVILRDLDLYLIKLAREFLLLASKTQRHP